MATPPGSTSPTLFKQWCGFFYIPQEQISESAVRRDLRFLEVKLREGLLIRIFVVELSCFRKSYNKNSYQNSVVINSSIDIAGICTSPPPPAETTPIGQTLSSTVIRQTCNGNNYDGHSQNGLAHL